MTIFDIMKNYNMFCKAHDLNSNLYIQQVIAIMSMENEDTYPVFLNPKYVWRHLSKKFEEIKFREWGDEDDDRNVIEFQDLLNVAQNENIPNFHWEKLSFPNCHVSKPQKRTVSRTHQIVIKEVTHQWIWLILLCAATILCSLFAFSISVEYGILAILLPIPFIFSTFINAKEGKTKISYKTVNYTEEEMRERERANDKSYARDLEYYYKRQNDCNKVMEEYEEKLQKRTKMLNECFDDILIAYMRNNLKTDKQELEIIQDPPQRGYLEDRFFYSLMKEYPNYVKVDRKKGNYYPDIVININDNAYIDIEIDEPYEYNSKKEIHYIGSSDEERNHFFVEENWFVIRFAEKQIKENLSACIDYVKGVVSFIETGNIDYLLPIKDDVVPRIKRWTKEEARLMAIENYREF